MIDVITYALLKKYLKEGGGGGIPILPQENYKVIEQKVASDVWTIQHDMKKYPCVIVVDSGRNTVYGEVRYIDENNVEVSFSAPFSGKVILN